jgi:Protein of unknown function, DUF481
MTASCHPNHSWLSETRFCAVALFLFLGLSAVRAQTTVLYLRNGDRLAGKINSEDTNHVVLTTPWAKDLSVPAAEIVRREILAPKAPTNVPPALAVSLRRGGSLSRKGTNVTAKRWKGEVRLGADYLYGASDQQIYYGRFKLGYERPLAASTNQFFRNYFDSSVDYGWTRTLTSGTNPSTTVISANSLNGSDKTDVDIGRKWYVYDLASAGYDQVLKINLQYSVGPGFGYHLMTLTNLAVNLEAGAQYQVQYRSDDSTVKGAFARLAEDVSWKLNKSLKFTEKFEFYPRLDADEYRAQAESTLSYALWRNISLNLSLLDLYDTLPAAGVPNNNLQVHSSVGITF